MPTARERGRTSSFRRTLGLGARAAAALQLLPFACAAEFGGTSVGLAEPWLLGPALNLQAFTIGPGQPALHTDYRVTAAPVVAAAVVDAPTGRFRRPGTVLGLGQG